ncbi:unnamed protein product, partial [Ixodes pacificus]
MPAYKLVDYKVPSSGRLAALLFTYAEVDFEYVTLEKSKAAEAEAAAPFGSLPVLYLDGEMLGSDYAICVFIAREHAKDLREKVPRYLRYFEKLLKQNNTDYFVGDQV